MNLKFKQKEQFAQASNDENFGSKFLKGASAVGATLVTGLAQAAVDTTAVETGIGEAATAVAAIGAAVVLVIVGIKVFKWIARSL